MRSMPPASSHLADKPVPAPPPTMGCFFAAMSRKRSRIFLRSMRAMSVGGGGLSFGGKRRGCRDLAEGGDQRRGEVGVVHVLRQAEELAAGTRAEARCDRLEERAVGLGIPEGLARRVQERYAALGQEEAHRAFHAV